MKHAIMEFIGTFFFVLTIIMTGNPIAIAAMLMAWVYIGGYVSGAHYNPAVSLAVAISHNWDWLEIAQYMIAQVLGAFAAMQAALFFTGKSVLTLANVNASFAHIFLMELLLTFVFAYVILVVSGNIHKFKDSKIFGAAIGFTVPALFALGGAISGAIFNPAIILGSILSVLFAGGSLAANISAYIPGQLLGGLLAAWAYKYFNVENANK